MTGIAKSYGGVHALKGVSLAVRKGSVHALLGENGAGKSTLMKILMGVERPDSGEIRIHGRVESIINPACARRLGISMVFQEINSVRRMSVADNIFLGREPVDPRTGLVDFRRMHREAAAYLAALQADIATTAEPAGLSVADNQLVEIAKAVSFGASIIVMDEPTSALSDVEAGKLFSVIRRLASEGISIIFISHKLDEIYEICDSITVLRDGANAGETNAADADRGRLISMMVGREVKDLYPKVPSAVGVELLRVDGLTRKGEFEDVSFAVSRGEILGIAGLMGSGRTELAETIFGLREADSGAVFVDGEELKARLPRDAIAAGIALVPEDRKNVGLMLRLPIRDNIVAASLRSCLGRFLIDRGKVSGAVSGLGRKLAIKAPDPSLPCSSLSGGNQQKVVIAKWLMTEPRIIILDEPTRGIDVGTKAQIHGLMSALAAEGKAVLMISSELPEVLGMSDRVIVLHEGRVSGELSRGSATPERVMALAMGESEKLSEERA